MDPTQVAEAFVKHYYTLLDTPDKAGIPSMATLYRPQSMMTWENQKLVGPEAILKSFSEMQWKAVQHKVNSTAVQPSGVPNALIVMCNGEMMIDGEHAMQFSQVWHLLQEGENFWIHNDMFKLSVG